MTATSDHTSQYQSNLNCLSICCRMGGAKRNPSFDYSRALSNGHRRYPLLVVNVSCCEVLMRCATARFSLPKLHGRQTENDVQAYKQIREQIAPIPGVIHLFHHCRQLRGKRVFFLRRNTQQRVPQQFAFRTLKQRLDPVFIFLYQPLPLFPCVGR